MDLAAFATLIAEGEVARDAQDRDAQDSLMAHAAFDAFVARLDIQQAELWAYYERCRARAADTAKEERH